jgi:hypothetical protein
MQWLRELARAVTGRSRRPSETLTAMGVFQMEANVIDGTTGGDGGEKRAEGEPSLLIISPLSSCLAM